MVLKANWGSLSILFDVTLNASNLDIKRQKKAAQSRLFYVKFYRM
jgi:hypothetical protein